MTAGEIHKKEPVIGNILAKMFSTYYARECCDTSFVLADDDDIAVGYVMCEPDYKRYGKLFRKIDVKNIYKLDKKSGFDAWLMPFPYFFLGLKYPAHLHIDILPEYHRKGYGGELVNTLFEHLEARGQNEEYHAYLYSSERGRHPRDLEELVKKQRYQIYYCKRGQAHSKRREKRACYPLLFVSDIRRAVYRYRPGS
jgi:GNAT superfamily N-acetyltransferase